MRTRITDRWRLNRVLDTIPAGGVGLVVAPAGSGKSILLGAHARDHEGSCWFELRDVHNDALVLARDLVSTIHATHNTVDPSLPRLVVNGGRRLGRDFVDALVAELAHVPTSVVLYFDDLHLLTDSEIIEDLGLLLANLPAPLRAVVASRWDMPIGLGRKRVQGGVVELRSAELAFEADEAVMMLQRTSGRQITPAQAKSLVRRTDGWAAGLQLAALSLANVSDIDAFIEHFAGDDRLVADYLTGEVLYSLDAGTRQFLLRTSVLEWLSPELCKAITGDVDACSTLRGLADRGLFLTRTQTSPERFRYHQLFADLLRYQLAAEDPTAETECRRLAASWLLDHRDYAKGVAQLLAAGDFAMALSVLEVEGHRFYERGETATLLRFLTRIHDANSTPVPQILIQLLAAQVAAHEYTSAAENYRSLSQRTDLTPGEHIAIDTLAAILGIAHLPLAEIARLADSVLAALPAVERSTVTNFLGIGGADTCEAIATFCQSLVAFFAGDVEASAHGFEHVLELPSLQYPIFRVITVGMLALARAWTGRLTDAENLAKSALGMAQEAAAMDHVALVGVHLSLAMTHLERLDTGAADIQLSAAASCVEKSPLPILKQLLHAQQVRQLAVTDSAQSALDHLHRSTFPMVRRPLLEQRLKTLEAQLLVRSGRSLMARQLIADEHQDVPAAWFDVLVAHHDTDLAREFVDTWEPPMNDQRAALEHELRSAVVNHLEGQPGVAGRRVENAALRAEAEGILLPFVETPFALGLLRDSPSTRPLLRIRALLEKALSSMDKTRSQSNEQLVEPLTPREMVVLEFLPSRLGNQHIADSLDISVNTLKTHLRNIYRKLDACDRDRAVEHATSCGLI